MQELSIEIGTLQARMLEAFRRISVKEAKELHSTLAAEALKRGFTYSRAGGRLEAINLMLTPTFFTEEQLRYITGLSHAVKWGVEAAYRAWFHDPEVERLLPFSEPEKKWILDAQRSRPRGVEPLWFRLDAHFHMKERDWKERISVFEINSCAVGGIHYSPTAEGLFFDCIMPVVKKHLPAITPVSKNFDLRELFMGLIKDHARSIGRSTLNFVFAEDTTLEEGITEGPSIVEYLKKKGVNAAVADPRELRIKGDEVYYKDDPVDVIYRNFELYDIVEMEAEGDDVAAIKLAFSKNQAVSSLCGDFDHKSMWEVLSSGAFDGYFSREDADLFKKHILWTRTVREAFTDGPGGERIDMVPFILKRKDDLVLKPNRLFGGYGVAIGRTIAEGEWERLVKEALKDESSWVVQLYDRPEEALFPLFEDDELKFEVHNIVYGLSSTRGGAGVLGRVSRQSVVNVAQQGGLMPVLRVS